MRYIIVVLGLLLLHQEIVSAVHIGWSIEVPQGTNSVWVYYPDRFEALEIDLCVEQVRRSDTNPKLFYWALFPNCAIQRTSSGNPILWANATYHIPGLDNSLPPINAYSHTSMSGDAMDGPIYTLVLPDDVSKLLHSVRFDAYKQGESVTSALDYYYQNTSPFVLRPSTLRSDPRQQCPLFSELVCQDQTSRISIWQITNGDPVSSHTILTYNGEQRSILPNTTHAIVVRQYTGSFSVQTQVAYWIDNPVWWNGVRPQDIRILPRVAPSASIQCYCGTNTDVCQPHFNQQRLSSVTMLQSREALARANEPLNKLLQQTRTLFWGSSTPSDVPLMLMLFIFGGIIMLVFILFIYVRHGGELLPNTLETHTFKRTVMTSGEYNDESDNESERQREKAYVDQRKRFKQPQMTPNVSSQRTYHYRESTTALDAW